MRILYIFLIIIVSLSLEGQNSAWLIGNSTGVGLDTKNKGLGGQFGFDVQKHLTKGLYVVAGFDFAHLSKSADKLKTREPFDYVPESLQQFRTLSLGLKKIQKISSNASVALSFNGVMAFQDRISWTHEPDPMNFILLNDSQELYSHRDDWAFSLKASYLYRVNSLLSIGAYTSYLSKPESIAFGVTSQIHLSKGEKATAAKSQSPSKHYLEWFVGIMGGDGTAKILNHELSFGRNINSWLAVHLQYAVGQRAISTDEVFRFLSDEERVPFEERFSADDNEAGLLVLTPMQSSSIGLGLRVKINGEGRSTLYALGTARYFKGNTIRLSSAGPSADNYQESATNFSEVLAEIGLQYAYTFSSNFYFGGKASLAVSRMNIGVALNGGVKF